MPFANLDDYKLYYKEYSPEKDEVIVFLHGFTLDQRMWEAEARFFSKDYRVILLDMKGHGQSDTPQTNYSRAHRVEDIVRFLDALNLNKVHLVGLSYGGTTGLGIALKYPERLKSLTLVATSAAGYSAGPKISKIDKIFKEKGIETGKNRWIETALLWYKDDKKNIKQLMTTMMAEHSYIPWLDPNRGKYPREYDLEVAHKINLPILILVGEYDKIFLPLAEQLHEKIPKSELKIYDKIGHMVNLEAPDKFHQDLEEFIQNL